MSLFVVYFLAELFCRINLAEHDMLSDTIRFLFQLADPDKELETCLSEKRTVFQCGNVVAELAVCLPS